MAAPRQLMRAWPRVHAGESALDNMKDYGRDQCAVMWAE